MKTTINQLTLLDMVITSLAIISSSVAIVYWASSDSDDAPLWFSVIALIVSAIRIPIVFGVRHAARIESDTIQELFDDQTVRMTIIANKSLLLRTIIDSMTSGLIVVDMTGKVILVNTACHKIIGIVVDNVCYDLIKIYGIYKDDKGTPITQDELPIIRALKEQEHVVDYILYHKNEMHPAGCWIKVNANPLYNQDGVMIGAVAIYSDITETRVAEQQLEQSTRGLRQSNSDLEQFAYVASHDLQEPLRMIISYLDMLKPTLPELTGDQTKYMKFISDGAIRMRALINGLLDFARISTRSQPSIPVDVEIVVSNILQNLAPAINETNAEVIVGKLPVVLADYNQLTQLMQNLVSNAIKFHNAERPKISIDAIRNNDHYEFRVSDNGIGIDNKYFDKIFVIFQTLHGRNKYDGTGIGLAICKKIVERHNGRIWVESTVGVGSVFHFTLPVPNQQDMRTHYEQSEGCEHPTG